MKTLKKLLIFCGLIICCGILQTSNVKAASRVIKLQPDRLYRNYDVNARLLNLKNGKKLLYLYAETGSKRQPALQAGYFQISLMQDKLHNITEIYKINNIRESSQQRRTVVGILIVRYCSI